MKDIEGLLPNGNESSQNNSLKVGQQAALPKDFCDLKLLEIRALIYQLPDFLNLGKKSSDKHFEVDFDQKLFPTDIWT